MAAKNFISRNLVAIVMVPLILGGHYGWYKLQQVDALVQPEERVKLPLLAYIQNMFSPDSGKAALKDNEN